MSCVSTETFFTAPGVVGGLPVVGLSIIFLDIGRTAAEAVFYKALVVAAFIVVRFNPDFVSSLFSSRIEVSVSMRNEV